MSDDNSLIIPGEVNIRPIEPDCLHAIEVFFAGAWAPVTFGEGLRLVAPSLEAGEHLIDQLKLIHRAKGKPMPPHRIRLMSKDETADVRRHLQRHNQDGKFGTDIRNIKPPERKPPPKPKDKPEQYFTLPTRN